VLLTSHKSDELWAGGETHPPGRKIMIYIVKSSKSTREHDLNYYEEFRSKLGNTRKVTNKLNEIYSQTNNEQLERLRYALIDAHKRHDLSEVERIENMIKQLTHSK